jgi:hypothetical protein
LDSGGAPRWRNPKPQKLYRTLPEQERREETRIKKRWVSGREVIFRGSISGVTLLGDSKKKGEKRWIEER